MGFILEQNGENKKRMLKRTVVRRVRDNSMGFRTGNENLDGVQQLE